MKPVLAASSRKSELGDERRVKEGCKMFVLNDFCGHDCEGM